MNLHSSAPARWLDCQAALRPKAPALSDGTRLWSYRGLRTAADRMAARLAAHGVRADTIVTVATGDPLTLTLLHLACPRLGAALLPLDPAMPAESQEAVRAQAGRPAVHLTAAALSGPRPAAPPSPGLQRPDRLHLVIATSGSTGTPKAVMLTGHTLAAHARASNARLGLGAGDAWLVCLPLFHIGGAAILWRCLRAGATIVLGGPFDAANVRAAVARHKVTHVSLVPAMLGRLLDLAPAPPPTLRHILVGGAALSPPLAERARAHGWPVRPTWGMSETCSQTATLAAPGGPWTPGSVGRPLDGLEVEAVAADANGVGRLRIRGPMVMAGYLTPERRPGIGLSDGWLVTNDLGRVAADGTVTVLGRADDMLLSGGKTIHPATVEGLMAACPELGACAVTGRADPVWGDLVAVAYTGPATPDAVLGWARAHLPGALRPRAAVRLATLPVTALGKPDRRRLRRLLEQAGEPAPVGDTEAET